MAHRADRRELVERELGADRRGLHRRDRRKQPIKLLAWRPWIVPVGVVLAGRRLALAGVTLLAAGGLGLATALQPLQRPAEAAANRKPPAPNIVLVMTDDQALSQAAPRYMPRVTKLLQSQGTTFENAFLTTPLCCPSRAALLTGQYGHNNGVLTNSYDFLRGKGNVLPAWLRRAGYVTAHVGKFLNRYHHKSQRSAVAPGWDQWYTELDTSQDHYYDWDLSKNGKKIHYGNEPSDYAPRVFERSAVRLTRRFVPRKKPLYLEVDEIAPHPRLHGKGTGCGPVPDPRDVGKFDNGALPRPPSFNEADMSDKPSFLARQPLLTQRDIHHLTSRYRCGLASLQEVDRTVGHLYHVFKDLGELGNTVFIFYTDNGVFFGEHRIRGKLYPYEEADRTPLYIRLPARYRNGRVAQVTQPVANIDFAPTILRLAHAKPCARQGHCRVMDGRNLLPLLRGKSPPWAAERPLGVELHIAYANRGHAVCAYAGVRQPGVVFVRHTRVTHRSRGRCVKDVERERYNLEQDPYELHNLCPGGDRCPKDAEQRRLRRLLARIRDCSGIRGRDPKLRNGSYCG
jgi:N-acetylglucosamine-6-sulfatase